MANPIAQTILPQETFLISVEEAKEILGKKGKGLSDSQIKEMLSKYQELVKWWLDVFEIKKFGKPIRELILK